MQLVLKKNDSIFSKKFIQKVPDSVHRLSFLIGQQPIASSKSACFGRGLFVLYSKILIRAVAKPVMGRLLICLLLCPGLGVFSWHLASCLHAHLSKACDRVCLQGLHLNYPVYLGLSVLPLFLDIWASNHERRITNHFQVVLPELIMLPWRLNGVRT